ncbi:MAG TPA: SDR family oxidoreductase [Micromonosporaceae bacterium]|nr:SDR family oxidoreductase [Micromonosporaceae bacterium]
MDLGLKDKRVLVTGASTGIGRATARIFAEEGARVAVTYNTAAERAAAVVEELGGADRSFAVPYELRDPASVVSAVDAVVERWGGIDVLVANAHWFTWVDPGKTPLFEDFPADEWMAQLRANVEGHLLTAQRALSGMRERGWGRIVILSSVTAHHGMRGSEIYSAARAAVQGFARGLMWSRGGVLVNVVAPGGTTGTDSFDSLAMMDPKILEQAANETPSGRLSTAEDVGRLIAFLCSEANGNINGEVIHIAGGR